MPEKQTQLSSDGQEKFEPPQSIMVIADDDEGRDGFFIKRAVKELGYKEIKVVTSAAEAVDLIISGVGNILITNSGNGSLSGIEATKRIKEDANTSFIPVTLTSHDRMAEAIVAARKAGVDGYVIKPLTGKSLLDQIYNVMKFRAKSLKANLKKSEKDIETGQYDLGKEQELKKELYAIQIANLTREISSFPVYQPNYMELGRLRFLTGSPDVAVHTLLYAIHLDSNAPEAYGLLTDYYSAIGNFNKAISFLKRNLSDKRDQQYYSKLGELQFKAGRTNDAIVTFNKSIAFAENQPDGTEGKSTSIAQGLNQRGEVFQEKGIKENNKNFMERAAGDFKRSGDLDPDLLTAHYNLMVTYKKLGDTKKALEVLDKIKNIEPQDFEGWIQVGHAYFQDNDTEKVAFALEKGVKIEWNNLDNRKQVCDLYIEYGMIDKAEALLLTTQKEVPDDIYFCNKLGMVYRRQGKSELAIEQYTDGLKHDPEDAVLWFNLGRALHDTGKTEEAKEKFKKSLELDPELEEAKEYVS